MKKEAISLFAVLAIVFAVSNAFIPIKAKPFAPDRYKIIEMVQDAVNSGSYTFAQVTHPSNINFTMYNSIDEINNVTPATGGWQRELNYTEYNSNVPGLIYLQERILIYAILGILIHFVLLT